MAAMRGVNMRNRKGDVIQWNELLLRAIRGRFGRRARMETDALVTRQNEVRFLKLLFSGARDVNPREPEEISRTTVDVYEKLCYNYGKGEDKTTVHTSNVESTEGHNYVHTTTNGVEFDFDSNVGLQFGLPQVRGGGGLGIGGSDTQQRQTEVTKSNGVEMQSRYCKETMRVPPGKGAVFRITTYKVRYKLEYTMEYKIAKNAKIRVSVGQSWLCLPYITERTITARELLRYLPGFREDDKFVYFMQDGELRWIADRMVVDKRIF